MTKTLSYAALAAAMAIAAPAFAQNAAGAAQSTPPVNGGEASTPRSSSTTAPAPTVGASGVLDQDAAASVTGPANGAGAGSATAGAATTGAAGGGASAATGSASNASATVATGMNVKDSTGAIIGQVTDVKADASGQQTATIKMGSDTFAVGTSSLAVRDGAALVNATQAELQAMLKK